MAHAGNRVSETRRLLKKLKAVPERHPGEGSMIEEVAQDVLRGAPPEGAQIVHSPTTETGLPVEEQVRKEWDSRNGGLPTFLREPKHHTCRRKQQVTRPAPSAPALRPFAADRPPA
jgi:hypothetical protein